MDAMKASPSAVAYCGRPWSDAALVVAVELYVAGVALDPFDSVDDEDRTREEMASIARVIREAALRVKGERGAEDLMVRYGMALKLEGERMARAWEG